MIRPKPRPPGLWLVDGKTDAQLVDEAVDELRKLLTDPYYFEAAQRLRKEINARRWPLTKKGALAADLQRGSVAPRNRGRPTVDRPGFRMLLEAIERYQKANGHVLSLREAASRVLRAMIATGELAPAREPEIRRAADKVAAALRDDRKKLRRRPLGK